MTPTPHPQQERCCHYDVCYMVHRGHGCINDKPTEIPCIFDSRKGVNFTACSRPAPSPRLNTQPKGTTCEDCQRFRKEECPYPESNITIPESNITIPRCNSFLMDVEAHDTHIRTTERNATLDELKAWFVKNKCNGCPYGGNLLDKIESLRGKP